MENVMRSKRPRRLGTRYHQKFYPNNNLSYYKIKHMTKNVIISYN